MTLSNLPLGPRLQRLAIAWLLAACGLSLSEKKAVITELLGGAAPSRARLAYVVALGMVSVANYQPKVFFAFPVALLVLATMVVWRLFSILWFV